MKRQLQARALEIPFRGSFTHASAERRTTQSVWVEIGSDSGMRGFGEGCPREYVTGESVASALDFIRGVGNEVRDLEGIHELRTWVAGQRARIDASPAAWCAVELALIDVMARESDRSVESLLEQASIVGPFQFSAVLGAGSPEVFGGQLEHYLRMGLGDFKVKLSGTEADLERVALLRAAGESIGRLRFDANNLWRSSAEAVRHLARLEVPFFAVEEPLAPGDFDGLRQIARVTGAKIILDESFLRIDQLERLDDGPSPWVLNLRVSKLGGLLRSLEIARLGQIMGIPFIIGCQVGETSLLTRAALTVSQAYKGHGLMAQEGAFGTLLLSADIVTPSLMFGRGGQLEVSAFNFDRSPGFGLSPFLASPGSSNTKAAP